MLLELNSVTLSYAMGNETIVALDRISWAIEQSEYVAITGTSGSGKSTMMNVIGCLDTPDEGQYFFEGKEITTFKDDELAIFRNRTIGFVFQQFNLLPYLSALENIMLPLRYAGKSRSASMELAAKALQEVGLEKRGASKPSQLSGGQQQRVAIARAIVTSPRLILADEPTGALDSKTANEILGLFDRLSSNGVAIVMVTHDMDVAARAQRITRLSDGKIVSNSWTR